MSSQSIKINRIFVYQGMTPEDIMNSPDAADWQKEFAAAFDADGIKGFSKKEAELFNASTITRNSDNTISLFTTYKIGNVIEQKFTGNIDKSISDFVNNENREVMPYLQYSDLMYQVRTTTDKPATDNDNKQKTPAELKLKELQDKGIENIEVKNFRFGKKIRSITYNDNKFGIEQKECITYYRDGNIENITVKYKRNDSTWVKIRNTNYAPNGNIIMYLPERPGRRFHSDFNFLNFFGL